MKKTLMLFALFLIIGTATRAQSISQIRDTLISMAPHMPTTHRWNTGDGKKWHDGVHAQFTQQTQDTVKMWMHDYPEESHDYKHYFEAHFNELDPPTGLSTTDEQIYWDIHAVWMMIHANHQH